jgi:hypothetical protein
MTTAPVEGEDADVEALKMSHPWIAVVETGAGERRLCSRKSFADICRGDLLGGAIGGSSIVRVHARNQAGQWTKASVALRQLVGLDFKLRVLYEPVWAHALAGLKWGALVGIGLKCVETFLRFLTVDPTLAIMFLVTAGICLIPRIGTGIMIGVSILMSKFTKVNLFFTVVAVILVGASLGCLPGMAIGAVVGYLRRRGLPRASDSTPEPPGLVFKVLVLPIGGSLGIWSLYFLVINPWLTGR